MKHQINLTYKGLVFPVSTSFGKEGDVVEIVNITPTYECSNHWYTATLPPSPKDLKVYLEKGINTSDFFDFMFHNTRDKVLALGGDIKIYDEAIAAFEKLKAARAAYGETMRSLGAKYQSEGGYEDYRDWYSIDGIPVEFNAG